MLASALLAAACGGSPAAPQPPAPPPPPPPVVQPPNNALPQIQSIRVQDRRPRTPARFADVSDIVDVVATVQDAETAPEAMTYEWTATHGTFSGTGANVTWSAPASISGPLKATLTLKLIERYGHPGQAPSFSHEVTSTVEVAVHDSQKEVADIARQFLTDFSTTSIKDWRHVMRNFSRSACPDPGEVELEQIDVENHYTNYHMHNYEIRQPDVRLNFGGTCELNKRGDACAVVGTYWDSTFVPGNNRKQTTGVDYLTAVYSTSDSRWWLCSSYFHATSTTGHSFYSAK